jgi:hypothetical protein
MQEEDIQCGANIRTPSCRMHTGFVDILSPFYLTKPRRFFSEHHFSMSGNVFGLYSGISSSLLSEPAGFQVCVSDKLNRNRFHYIR